MSAAPNKLKGYSRQLEDEEAYCSSSWEKPNRTADHPMSKVTASAVVVASGSAGVMDDQTGVAEIRDHPQIVYDLCAWI